MVDGSRAAVGEADLGTPYSVLSLPAYRATSHHRSDNQVHETPLSFYGIFKYSDPRIGVFAGSEDREPTLRTFPD